MRAGKALARIIWVQGVASIIWVQGVARIIWVLGHLVRVN